MLYEVITEDDEEVVEFRPGLPTDLQHVLEPLRRDQRRPDPLPLEEGVRRNGRAVNDADARRDADAPLRETLEHRLGRA